MSIVIKKFPSLSDPTIEYRTEFNTLDGTTSCTCKGWLFKRGPGVRSCTHTRQLSELANGNAAVTADPEIAAIDIPHPVSCVGNIPDPPKEVAPTTPSADVQPMLASAMPDGRKVSDYARVDWVMEEKIDGHRVLVTVTNTSATARTRPSASHPSNDRPLPPHITQYAMGLMPGVYDGELYVPGGTSSDVTRLDKQLDLVLMIFDVIEMTGKLLTSASYRVRQEFLFDAADLAELDETTPVRHVKSSAVSQDAIDAIWARGGEGVILKDTNSLYISGARSASWIKVKRLESATLTITGFRAGKLGPASIVELVDAAGASTTVKVLNNETLADITAVGINSYVGKQLVISHQGRTKNNVYRHPCWDHVL